MKTIGILGGLGPSAGVKLYQNIITTAQKKYGAVQDGEHPQVRLHSTALTGFDENGSLNDPVASDELCLALQTIEDSGADFIIMACNTVHLLHEKMSKALRIPLLHMVNEVVSKIPTNFKKIGVLSSAQSAQSDLYSISLKKHGFETLHPSQNQQGIINDVVYAVMTGTQNETETNKLKSIALDLQSQGAEAIVLGCTELPLAITPTDLPDTVVFDSLQIAADVCLSLAMK